MAMKDILEELSRALKTFRRREDGAAAAEFAMVAWVMGILTFIIMEAGAMMYAYNSMHNAAREAVRRFAVQDGIVYDTTGLLTYSCQIYVMQCNF